MDKKKITPSNPAETEAKAKSQADDGREATRTVMRRKFHRLLGRKTGRRAFR